MSEAERRLSHRLMGNSAVPDSKASFDDRGIDVSLPLQISVFSSAMRDFAGLVRKVGGLRCRQDVIRLLAFLVASVVSSTAMAAPYRYVAFDIPGSTSTKLEGINNDGHIVGTYVGPTTSGAFVYDGTEIALLPRHGDDGVLPSDINERGQIVGTLFPPSVGGIVPSSQGFVFEQGTYSTFVFPGAAFTGAGGLNNQGQIVGAYRTGPGLTPARGYTFDGTQFRPIVVPNAFASGANSVNDDSIVVGTVHVNDLLIASGYVVREGTVSILATSFAQSLSPDDINRNGVVAGSYLYSAFDGFRQGFVLDGTTWSPIHFPGSRETWVGGINDHNDVVGTYRDIDGRFHGFIAYPIPEPTTLVLLMCGVAMIVAIRLMKSRIGEVV